jgi:uncharacterized protein YeaO (DUF488 family)
VAKTTEPYILVQETMVKLKRAYDPPAPSDGYRVLVDRLWPRGVRKQNLEIDAWERPVAPSSDLRRWFGHDPKRWSAFRQRYRHELREGSASERLQELAARAARGTVTLIFASHDREHNNAVVLKDELARLSRQRRG